MAFLLLEITSRDAYERFYKSIPEDEYYTIIQAVQGKDNDEILLPETKWVLGLRKKNSPRFMEDLQKLRGIFGDGYLDIFLRAKERRMISGTQADLNQYKSISELGRFVSSLDVDAILGQTKGEQSNAIHEAKDDIEKLYEDDKWIILIPKTHEASCYWAKGAHWCTAYRDDDEWFNKYSSEGPLFMNINKENPQLSTQFHIESEQYMDYYDDAIEEPIFEHIHDGDTLLDFYQNYLPAEKFMSMIGSELGNGLYAAYLYDYDYGEEGHDDEYAYFMVDINMKRLAGPFEDMYNFNGNDVTRVIYDGSKYNLVDTEGKLQFDEPLLIINQVHNLKNKFVGETCNASSMDDDGNITTIEKSHIVAYDNGQVIHFPQYNVFTCYGNFTLVKGKDNFNILNSDFQPIFKHDYLHIRPFALGGKQYFAIQKMNKWNLSDISGNILWDNWVYDLVPNLNINGLPIKTLKVNTGIGLNLYDVNGNPMMGEDVKKFTWSNWKTDGVVSGVMMLNGDHNFLDNKFNIIDRDGKILHKGLYEPMNESRKILNENYHGEICHFTSLIQGSWIIDDDALYANISQSDECEGVSDNRKYIDSDTPFISFTRDKNYSIQGHDRSTVCFVFDGDDIQKIRNARLYPFSFGGYGREESEERVYGVNIKPLHKYLKRIEIKLSNKPYSWSSDRQFDEEDDLEMEFKTKFPDLDRHDIDQLISEYLVKKITNNKLVGGKVVIKNNVNENRKVLNEITVKDAYTKYYQDIPERDFQRIVLNIQKDNDTLLPETKWVLKLYKTKSPRLMEDLYKLCNDRGDGYLDVFKRAKERRVISGTQADLNQYKSIAELGRFVSSLDIDKILGKTKGEISNAVNAAAEDIEVPYEDDVWKVVIPKSYEASCYWGNGTEWCTATRETSEWYEYYSRQGRLYINIDKRDGSKFQFHFETVSFMDEYDHEIEKPVFENMEATPDLVDFYEEELTPTNFDKLSEVQNFYNFVERLNDRYFIAEKTSYTEIEYYDWEDTYNIIDSYNETTKIDYGFDDYDVIKELRCVLIKFDDSEQVFDYQHGYVIFNEWVSKVTFNIDNRKITGIKNDDFIYCYDKDSLYAGYNEYKIADVISQDHLYLVNEDEYESEYCNIFDIETGDFLFDKFYDSYESSYYKGSLKPILLLWDVENGIRKYNLDTLELNYINLDIEYKDVRFLNDYQFAVQFDSVKGDEKWMIYDVDSLQPRFNGAEFDYVICNYETSATPLVCYKGKWNIINFFKGKFAFPDLWFDDITPKSQLINNRPYFTASIGDKKYLITASGSIHEKPQRETIFTSPKEISRTDPEYITKENNMKLSVNDIQFILSEAKRLISEISVKDAYAHYQDTIPEDVYKWWVMTIQGDNADNAQLDSDTKWILKRYEKEGDSMFGKAEQIVNAINIFKRMRVRGMLPQGVTLEQCSSIDELIAFTNSVNYDEVFARTQKELDRDIKAAKNDIDVVFENDDWFVLIPKSMEASIYWGSKTKWCTATKTIENNRFEQYSENGPLYININKKTHAKYQFSFADGEWNDAQNDEIPFPIMKNIEGSDTLAPFYQKLCTGHLEWAKKPMFELDIQYTTRGWEFCENLEVNCREVINNEGKCNIITEGFRLVSDVWFDTIEENHSNYGFAMVTIGDGIYYFDYTKGLKDEKYAYFGGFLPMGKFSFYAIRHDMKSIVMTSNEKFNLIDGSGKILLDTWFDEIDDDYENRCFIGKLNGEKYIIDRNNKIIKQ